MSPALPREHEVFRAARALRAALTTLGDALAAGDVRSVLDAEPALIDALASVTTVRSRPTPVPMAREEAAALAKELEAARAALARCAALGRSLDDFVRGRGFATATYDATGVGVTARVRSAFDQKV